MFGSFNRRSSCSRSVVISFGLGGGEEEEEGGGGSGGGISPIFCDSFHLEEQATMASVFLAF